MDALTFVQLLLNAAALGAAYALVALGFVLVINATGAVNFAHGDLVMAGGFLTVALAGVMPLPGIVLLPVVAALMAILGLVLSAAAYLPLQNRPPVAIFISTIAVGVMLQNGANAIFGAAPRGGPPLVGDDMLSLGGVVLDRQSAAVIAAAVVLLAATQILLTHTQLGKRMRATAQDPEMARALGVRTGRMVALTFALAAALAGAAGLLLGNRYFVTPAEGGSLMLKAYIAVVIGGWGRIGGAVIGALLIALFESVVAAFLSQPVAEAALYAVLLIVLFL
ncbi:MAG: branched-chain amino acid ABC transporter permease, partial [Alphaproteobacteria bacterium]